MSAISNKISSSLDWNQIEIRLMHQSVGLMHGREIRQMIRNIGFEIEHLSRAEVELRRGRKLKAVELLEKINQDIQLVEEFLLVAALIG